MTALVLASCKSNSKGDATGAAGDDAQDTSPLVDGSLPVDALIADVAAVGTDADPRCARLAPLTLVDPMVTPSAPLPGQSATVQITLSNGGVAYPFYPGATLGSSTTGATIAVPYQGLALLDAGQRRPLSWQVTLAPSLAAGTRVELSARVAGEGRADCPDAHVLPFSFTLGAPPPVDAGLDAARLDDAGAGFVCGSATCRGDQYCLSISGGPAPQCFPHPEAGPCPAGTREGCQSPFFRAGCQEDRGSARSCVDVAATCATPCTCLCGGPAGCFQNGRDVTCAYP